MADIDEMEHHACLLFDEPQHIEELFKLGVQHIEMDLRGRKTLLNDKKIDKDLGLTKQTHSFVTVERNNVIINNINELNDMIETYRERGATVLYIVRLKVHWNPGNEDEWERRVIHEYKFKRRSGINRLNALIIRTKHGLLQEVRPYVAKYGREIVQPTLCHKNPPPSHKPRVCYGLTAEYEVRNNVLMEVEAQ